MSSTMQLNTNCVTRSYVLFLQDILEKVQALAPHAPIVDSVQTVQLKGVTGSAGRLSQVSAFCFVLNCDDARF